LLDISAEEEQGERVREFVSDIYVPRDKSQSNENLEDDIHGASDSAKPPTYSD
jgi:hypothetical protein